MSKVNRKRNKKYVPKPCHLPSIFGMSKKMSTDLALPPYLILDQFRMGMGTEEGAHTLAACLNVGAMISQQYSEEVQALMSRGLDAVQSVMDRGNSTGQWGLSGQDLKDIGSAIDLASDLQEDAPRREVMNAIHETMRAATA